MKKRTDGEMLETILSFAREDERVRAVWMNGSRANPNAPKDGWQDFDIVFAVTDMESFLADDTWVDRFGERVLMQSRRDQYDAYNEREIPDFSEWFIYLMQFSDGNRLDLSLIPVEKAPREVLSDSMCIVWLDKDGILPEIPPASDADYWVKLPSKLAFHCSVNEFHWVSTNVAKGLWRGELSYAQEMLSILREELIRQLSWKAGLLADFPVNPGKCGKFLPRYLPEKDWADFLETYALGDEADIRRAFGSAWELFARLSRENASALGYSFEEREEARVLKYLERND